MGERGVIKAKKIQKKIVNIFFFRKFEFVAKTQILHIRIFYLSKIKIIF